MTRAWLGVDGPWTGAGDTLSNKVLGTVVWQGSGPILLLGMSPHCQLGRSDTPPHG